LDYAERAAHFENLCRRIREAGGWADEFDNTPYLASCMRAERDAYRKFIESIVKKLEASSAAPSVREEAIQILEDWP